MHHELLTLLKHKFSGLYNASFDHIIAPPFCSYCKQFLTKRMIFCVACYDMIQPIVSVQLPITKNFAMTVLAISDYQEPLKSLILSKSWSDIVAAHQLGQLLWQMSYFKHMQCDYLVPIPLHWMRFAKRGYNQAEEIAKVLSQHKNVPVAHILSRSRNTPFQSSIAADKRLANVKDAFILKKVDPQLYHNKNLVLVDDLMTSGATLISAAKTLLKCQPAAVHALVVCRVC